MTTRLPVKEIQKDQDDLNFEVLINAFRANDLKTISDYLYKTELNFYHRQKKIFKAILENKDLKNYKILNTFLPFATGDFYSNTNLEFLTFLNEANFSNSQHIKENLPFFLKHLKLDLLDQIGQFKRIIQNIDKTSLINLMLLGASGSYYHNVDEKQVNKIFNILKNLDLIPYLKDNRTLLYIMFHHDQSEVLLNFMALQNELFPDILYKKNKENPAFICNILNKKAKNIVSLLEDMDMMNWKYKDGKNRSLFYYIENDFFLEKLLKNVSLVDKDNFNKTSLYYLNLKFDTLTKIKNIVPIFTEFESYSLNTITDMEPDIRKFLFGAGFRQKQKKWIIAEETLKLIGSLDFKQRTKIQQFQNNVNSFYEKLMLHKIIDLSMWEEPVKVKKRVLL